jgi:hypothetical protein
MIRDGAGNVPGLLAVLALVPYPRKRRHLHAYLDDLLRNRERVLAAADVDQWARAEAVPSQEEISRIRQLIARVENGLEDLTAAEREQTSQAVDIVRRHRTVALGMPRLRQALPDIRPERSA